MENVRFLVAAYKEVEIWALNYIYQLPNGLEALVIQYPKVNPPTLT
jgi:hypothetical protein